MNKLPDDVTQQIYFYKHKLRHQHATLYNKIKYKIILKQKIGLIFKAMGQSKINSTDHLRWGPCNIY